jgi:ribosome-associated protein
MTEPSAIAISTALRVPLAELQFQASRSGGPGGQHVNTSSTRVELWWNLRDSPSLTAGQRVTLLARLATRLTDDGALRIVSSETRSQARNKDAAIARFQAIVSDALRPVKVRRKTRPSKAVKERRLQEKRQRSQRKQERRKRGSDD